MDKSKLYLAVMIIGCAFLLFGGIRYLSNLEQKFDQSKSEMTIFGRNDLGNMLNLKIENQERERRRSSAIVLIFIGAVGIVVGIVLKPKKNLNLIDEEKNNFR